MKNLMLALALVAVPLTTVACNPAPVQQEEFEDDDDDDDDHKKKKYKKNKSKKSSFTSGFKRGRRR